MMYGLWELLCIICKNRTTLSSLFCFIFLNRICARYPYVANDERRLLEIIRSNRLRFESENFRNLSSEGLDFLQGMLVYDTVHRRTMGELTVHPWLTVCFDYDEFISLIHNSRVDLMKDQRKI